MELTFWVGDASGGDSPTTRFCSGPSGQLTRFQMVGLRGEHARQRLGFLCNQGLREDAGIGEALSRSISRWAPVG